MAVRGFDGTDDAVICALGNAGVQAGPLTLAALVKLTADGTWAHIHGANSAATVGLGLYKRDVTNQLRIVRQESSDAGAIAFTVANGWAVVAMTKASGTTTPTAHLFPLGGAWTHTAGGGTLADSALTLASYRFGRCVSGNDPAAMRLAVAGVWDVAMSDAQVEAFVTNLKTSDWYNHASGTPKGLWEFNQATVSAVADVTGGGANETSAVGTTVVNGDDPTGWSFDGTGDLSNVPGPPNDLLRYTDG